MFSDKPKAANDFEIISSASFFLFFFALLINYLYLTKIKTIFKTVLNIQN
jgi:hypothetical protein